jgi:hypothetical protein
MHPRIVLLLLVFSTPYSACAAIVGIAGGNLPPPPTLGPYDMTPFPPDPRPLLIDVTDVPSPLGGAVEFSIPLSHRRIGEGWPWWHPGYTGDVYWTKDQTSVSLFLPDSTMAYYLYAGHDTFSPRAIWVIADDGTTVEQLVFSGEARYYGFYQDDPSGPALKSLLVASTVDFAIGEFGIAVPEPGALGLLGAGALLVRSRRR